MAHVVCEPLRRRCPECSVLGEFNVSDYPRAAFGHGRREELVCPGCGHRISLSFKDLPAAWQKKILADEADE